MQYYIYIYFMFTFWLFCAHRYNWSKQVRWFRSIYIYVYIYIYIYMRGAALPHAAPATSLSSCSAPVHVVEKAPLCNTKMLFWYKRWILSEIVSHVENRNETQQHQYWATVHGLLGRREIACINTLWTQMHLLSHCGDCAKNEFARYPICGALFHSIVHIYDSWFTLTCFCQSAPKWRRSCSCQLLPISSLEL